MHFRTLRLTLLDSHFVATHHKYEVIKSIKLHEFKEFAKEFTKEMRIVSLMQGNIDANKAHGIMDNVLQSLQCKPVECVSEIQIETAQSL